MAEMKDTLETADGRYVVRVLPDSRGGYRAKLYRKGTSDPIMEPHAADKISAVLQLVRELDADFSTGDKEIGRQIDKELEKSLNANTRTAEVKTKSGSLKIHDAELEKDFGKFERVKKKTKDHNPQLRAMVEVLLGDENYAKHFRMPGWNGTVNMLRDPKVAIRYHAELGVPTSKNAHHQRAETFHKLAEKLNRAWNNLVDRASKKFGKEGSLISAVYRDHFPPTVKDRLRFLAQGETVVKDAVRLHETLSKSRSPLFT